MSNTKKIDKNSIKNKNTENKSSKKNENINLNKKENESTSITAAENNSSSKKDSYFSIKRLFRKPYTIKSTIATSLLVASFICTLLILNNISNSRKASASITKYKNIANSETALTPITYNGEEMYVAKASFYDYYSDSQVGDSSTPNNITDALTNSKNTFSKLNKKLMSLLKYNDSSQSPAKYPLYQGRPGALSDMDGICYPFNEDTYITNNYWFGANSGQGTTAATTGLVSNKLSKNSNGNTYIMQSNPDNNKSSKLPFFDKNLLTKNKHENSDLPLAAVYENLSFPFREYTQDGIIYYEFASNKDTIQLKNSKIEYLGYNNPSVQVKDASGGYGFFPYNSSSDSTSSSLNFGHGVRIDIPFNSTKDGKLNNKDMIFEFSGDDDVWVFIDGYLALDLGGNHGEVTGSINFAKGISTTNQVKNNKVAFAKRALSSINPNNNTITGTSVTNEQGVLKDVDTSLDSSIINSLKDISKTHTLTLFYMERGLNVANMKIKFNLPRPTILNVTNTVISDNVNNTFKDETNKVIAKDEFQYDVLDKTLNSTDEISLLDKEAVTFSNEFDKNDNLLVQQKSLKISSRKMTTLYTTSWELKDMLTCIEKGNNLLVTDKRGTVTNSFLFANKDNSDTPVLSANFTNKPNTGDYELSCNVSKNYIKENPKYKDDKYTYYITHNNIFGGNSKKVPFNGKYTLFSSDGKKSEEECTGGKITLKPEEKIIIQNIPVETTLNIKVYINNNVALKNISTTNNFKTNVPKLTTTGNINSSSNITKYTFGTKKEQIQTTPKNPYHGTSYIDSKKENTNSDLSQLENINEGDPLDDSPTTSDSSKMKMWIILTIISIIVCISSLMYLIRIQTLTLKL